MNFPGHFEENLDTGTNLLFPGQSGETRDGWQVCINLLFKRFDGSVSQMRNN